MQKKWWKTGLGLMIHPFSTITASPGMEVGITRRLVHPGPEVESLPIRYQSPGLSRMVSTKLSEKQVQIPAKSTAFHLSVPTAWPPGFASRLASFQLLKAVFSRFVKCGLIIYS